MRKVFAILVPLCIGVVCGFIVPSSISEVLDKDDAILAENDLSTLDDKLSTIEPGFVVISDGAAMANDKRMNSEKLREIDDKALYENSVDKENNLNERSYIYINQRFKPPSRNEYLLMKDLELKMPVKNMFTPTILNKEIENIKRLPKKMSYGFFEPSLNEMILKNDLNDGFIFTNSDCDDSVTVKKLTESRPEHNSKINTNINIFDDQLNYIELLKPPSVRPVSANNKIRHDYPSTKDVSAALVVNSNNFNDLKYFNSESPPVAKHKETMRNSAVFRPLHPSQKTVLDRSKMGHREDKTFFEQYDSLDRTYRPLHESLEERRELESDKKDEFYKEKVSNEKFYINYDDCNYKDCVLKNKKFQRKADKIKCRCPAKRGRKGNKLQKQGPSKEEVKMNKKNIVIKPEKQNRLEDVDYGNNQLDKANKSFDDELLKTVNSLNYTLQMYP